MNEPNPDDDVRRALERDGLRTSARHDERVLAAARAFANEADATARRTEAANDSGRVISLRPRTRQWLIPLALAACFAVGLMTRFTLDSVQTVQSPGVQASLMLPLDTTRGSDARAIPVESANPDDWYRYIQELVAAGETHEAERHLRRFNELHPDYTYQP